jgi:hypothetical protein
VAPKVAVGEIDLNLKTSLARAYDDRHVINALREQELSVHSLHRHYGSKNTKFLVPGKIWGQMRICIKVETGIATCFARQVVT